MARQSLPRVHCDVVAELPEEWLSEQRLQLICHTDDLSSVEYLELQVDSTRTTIEGIGHMLPNLRQLKLNDSNVSCVRDLGTQFPNLEVLWMCRCGLRDLSGVSALSTVRELYLAFNYISDLSPLLAHDSIEVLDLEGNAVAELHEFETLAQCPKLCMLTIIGNPVTSVAGFESDKLKAMLPQLETLDALDSDLMSFERFDGESKQVKADVLCLEDEHPSWDTSCGIEISDSDDEVSICSEGVGDHVQHRHPLLAKGLTLDATLESEQRIKEDEPDEYQLILEQLKQRRAKPFMRNAFSDRPSTSAAAWFEAAAVPLRPSTADLLPERMPSSTVQEQRASADISGDAASELTHGETVFAGTAVTAIRRRRMAAGTTVSHNDYTVDIQELLRRYRTYTQPSCLPPEELAERKAVAQHWKALDLRPETPDVRIRNTGRPGTAGPLEEVPIRRPGSSQGFDERASRQGGTSTSKVEILDLTDSAAPEGKLRREVVTVPKAASSMTRSHADPQRDTSDARKSFAKSDDVRLCREELSGSLRRERSPAGHRERSPAGHQRERSPAGHQREGSPAGLRRHDSRGVIQASSCLDDCRSLLQTGVVAGCPEGSVRGDRKRKSKRDTPQKSGLRRSQSLSGLRSSERSHGDMRRSSSGAALRPSPAAFEAWRNAPVDLE